MCTALAITFVSGVPQIAQAKSSDGFSYTGQEAHVSNPREEKIGYADILQLLNAKKGNSSIISIDDVLSNRVGGFGDLPSTSDLADTSLPTAGYVNPNSVTFDGCSEIDKIIMQQATNANWKLQNGNYPKNIERWRGLVSDILSRGDIGPEDSRTDFGQFSINYILAVISAESGGNPDASAAPASNAKGLMQIIYRYHWEATKKRLQWVVDNSYQINSEYLGSPITQNFVDGIVKGNGTQPLFYDEYINVDRGIRYLAEKRDAMKEIEESKGYNSYYYLSTYVLYHDGSAGKIEYTYTNNNYNNWVNIAKVGGASKSIDYARRLIEERYFPYAVSYKTD